MQTISQLKAFLVSIKPDVDIVSDDVIIQLINEVDGSIWYDIMNEKAQAKIALTTEIAEYSLPENVTFNLVIECYLDDYLIPKIDESFKDTTGYMRGSIGGKLKIYPVPTTSDEIGSERLTVAYTKPYAKHTALTDTVLVDAPYDHMYLEYIAAKISLFKSDVSTYNSMIELFNATKLDFEKWYKENPTAERVW